MTYVKIVDMTTRDGINAALKEIGASGFDGVKVTAPNAVQALGVLLRKTKIKKADYVKIIRELKRQGLVDITNKQDLMSFTITPAGIYRLQQVIINEIEIPKPKPWDKKWRLVTYDVPVRQSKERAYFTAQLQKLGFVMLQKSLWAYPFPCFEKVEQLAGHYNLARYITFLEVDRLDDISSQKLVRRFSDLLS
jgi:DNA-binding transcriptional regulator PaaX